MQAWSEERLDTIVGNLLRAGVVLAAALVLAGGIVYLMRHGGEAPHGHTFRGEPEDLRTFQGIVSDVARGSGRGIIQLGLVCLIATPVARVVLLVFGFLMQRDRLYAAVALIVLCILLYSLAVGYV